MCGVTWRDEEHVFFSIGQEIGDLSTAALLEIGDQFYSSRNFRIYEFINSVEKIYNDLFLV